MSDLYFKLYQTQVNRTMQLAELVGNAIGSLRSIEMQTHDEFTKKLCREYIEEINSKFHGDETK